MSASTIPLFGRSWKLTVQYPSGNSTEIAEVLTQDKWDPEALRMTFDVLQAAVSHPFWYADISIYNFNPEERDLLNKLFSAIHVTLEAGYQTGPTKRGIIWDGPVLQVLFDRENVVDQRITLHCLATIPEIQNNIVNHAVGPLATQAQAVQQMMDSIRAPRVTFGPKASTALASKQYPRGKTFFGRANKYLTQLADDHFMEAWNDGESAYLSELDSPNAKPNLIYAPPFPPNYNPQHPDQSITYSLIGTPRASVFGVIFTVLLDPRLKVGLPPLVVMLDQTVITQMKTFIDPNTMSGVLSPVDPSKLCVVGQVRHRGDTRGNDWITEVTAVWRNYAANMLLGLENAQ